MPDVSMESIVRSILREELERILAPFLLSTMSNQATVPEVGKGGAAIGGEYLTVGEAALMAARHPETIREALRLGELKGKQRKKGANWRIHQSDLHGWLTVVGSSN